MIGWGGCRVTPGYRERLKRDEALFPMVHVEDDFLDVKTVFKCLDFWVKESREIDETGLMFKPVDSRFGGLAILIDADQFYVLTTARWGVQVVEDEYGIHVIPNSV